MREQGPSQADLKIGDQRIKLKSQNTDDVPGFILANALCPRCQRPTPPNQALANVTPDPCDCDPPIPPGRHPVVQENSHEGQELVICGAGPSLAKYKPFLRRFTGEVWGANRGLNFLHKWGLTHAKGIAIDPFTTMFGDVWKVPPETDYFLATTVNPGLVWHLEAHDRPITYFHSLRGIKDEKMLYALLYPYTVLAGHGLNVVNRALDVAAYMGFSKIYLAGADNAFGPDDTLYAEGDQKHGDHDVVLEGEVDGKHFKTKSDMLMSAVELVRRQKLLKREGKRVVFLGKTLPKALEGKSEAFLKRIIDWRPDDPTDSAWSPDGVL